MIKIRSLFRRVDAGAERVSDIAANWFGRPISFLLHFIWWGCWIGFGVEKFPYGLLTMILSLEAIVLSALILNASNRQQNIDSKLMEKDIYLGQTTKTNLDHIHNDLEEVKTALDTLLRKISDDRA